MDDWFGAKFTEEEMAHELRARMQAELTPNAAVSGRGETKPGEKDGGCTASA